MLSKQPEQPRSYNVLMPSGNICRRKRRDLLKTRESDMFREDPSYTDGEIQDNTHRKTNDDITNKSHASNKLAKNTNVSQLPQFQFETQNVETQHKTPPSVNVKTRSGRVVKKPTLFKEYHVK